MTDQKDVVIRTEKKPRCTGVMVALPFDRPL